MVEWEGEEREDVLPITFWDFLAVGTIALGGAMANTARGLEFLTNSIYAQASVAASRKARRTSRREFKKSAGMAIEALTSTEK